MRHAGKLQAAGLDELGRDVALFSVFCVPERMMWHCVVPHGNAEVVVLCCAIGQHID